MTRLLNNSRTKRNAKSRNKSRSMSSVPRPGKRATNFKPLKNSQYASTRYPVMNRKITPVKSRDCSLSDFNFRQADWLLTRSRSHRGEGTARGWAAESAINYSTTLIARAHVRWRQIIGAASHFAREKNDDLAALLSN